VRHSPAELSKLKDYLTINVTSFFRDREKFEHLQKVILPELLRAKPQLRIWSAGCSRGHEPYSLGIILAEMTGAHRRHEILATDIDQSALAWAKAGGPYSQDELSNMPTALRQRYFKQHDDGYYVMENLRSRITFRQHNLLSETLSFVGNGQRAALKGSDGFDLIICRNVVIYFTSEVKDRLYRHFYNALRPGGILFVGGTEIVSNASNIGFETAGISFYRRNGVGKTSLSNSFLGKERFGGK
jgi:chemotaxis protein methyltransferase CheR